MSAPAHAAGPVAHAAATCSDHANQRAAQRAKDTRDADGDGVYCEALPCPCSRPGGERPRSQPREPRRTKRPKRAQVIEAQITEVVDGDTVKVRAWGARRSRYTVRLIGIDTPETRKPGTPVECAGREATSNLLRLAFAMPEDTDGDGLLDARGGDGVFVMLTTDPTQDLTDRYGRLLAT